MSDLLTYWRLDAPHLVGHDYGGASRYAHLLHGAEFASLALVDVVALAPWSFEFFRLVRDNADTFAAQPAAVHEGAVRSYIATASYTGLTNTESDMLLAPWQTEEGQLAFYRQIAQADQRFTDDSPMKSNRTTHRCACRRT